VKRNLLCQRRAAIWPALLKVATRVKLAPLALPSVSVVSVPPLPSIR
jgi:hypothetical protein